MKRIFGGKELLVKAKNEVKRQEKKRIKRQVKRQAKRLVGASSAPAATSPETPA